MTLVFLGLEFFGVDIHKGGIVELWNCGIVLRPVILGFEFFVVSIDFI